MVQLMLLNVLNIFINPILAPGQSHYYCSLPFCV